MNAVDCNLNPHAFAAGILLTEPSLQVQGLNKHIMCLPESLNQGVSMTERVLLKDRFSKSRNHCKLILPFLCLSNPVDMNISTICKCISRWMSLKLYDCFLYSTGASMSHPLNERHLIRRHFKVSALNIFFSFMCV